VIKFYLLILLLFLFLKGLFSTSNWVITVMKGFPTFMQNVLKFSNSIYEEHSESNATVLIFPQHSLIRHLILSQMKNWQLRFTITS